MAAAAAAAATTTTGARGAARGANAAAGRRFVIFQHVLREDRPIGLELQKVYGVGPARANKICSYMGFNPWMKVSAIPTRLVPQVRVEIEARYVVEAKLKEEIRANIQRLVDIECYRGYRHATCLPVHGQRTKTNRRTQRRVGAARLKLLGVRPKKPYFTNPREGKAATGYNKKNAGGGGGGSGGPRGPRGGAVTPRAP